MKRRRVLLASSFVLVAALLPAYFFQYRWERYHCLGDVCDFGGEAVWSSVKTLTFYSKPHPLLNPITHKVALVDGQPMMVRSAYDGAMGIFTRTGVPVIMAWIGGVLIPLGLLGCATVLVARRTPN